MEHHTQSTISILERCTVAGFNNPDNNLIEDIQLQLRVLRASYGIGILTHSEYKRLGFTGSATQDELDNLVMRYSANGTKCVFKEQQVIWNNEEELKLFIYTNKFAFKLDTVLDTLNHYITDLLAHKDTAMWLMHVKMSNPNNNVTQVESAIELIQDRILEANRNTSSSQVKTLKEILFTIQDLYSHHNIHSLGSLVFDAVLAKQYDVLFDYLHTFHKNIN